ncbi:terminase large subunit [Bacillus capparidis]|uniref:Phage terminase large subunit-like protein n=1 Tax=Bacillus capparidis TaxID=1840411 RepID=A0ABS4D1J4_9BACI|nr:terminase TerL endonuclease subunit [Bacillus capparidis]MBP1083496.1 phage terminase large subunit-like protein [Bacillus capparidis]MED1094696.1 terminase large subunit [Bacillus capparidis]
MNRVTQYALDVDEGRIVTGKYARLACERHLHDLESENLASFRYRFDEEKANRINEFAETLVIAEGEGKEQLQLADFQAFILGSLFGWVDKETGYRRFRNSYIQLGRQNGKSLLNGILGTYCSGFDGYNYAQIYCTATKSDQAKIVFNEIVKFINADPDLEELFKVKDYESTIISHLTHSTVRALGRDTKSIDGFRPYLGIVDEYHAHKDNQMYKLLEGGTGKLKQSLISVITTAGFDLNSPCYELYNDCCKLLEGAFSNETQFVYIAQLDKDDDIWDSENWIKANPLVCADSDGVDRMKDIAAKAKRIGGEELRDFLTKRINAWFQLTDDDYINIENWKKCATELTLEDMRGNECVVGLDLSSGGDLTSLALEFPVRFNDQQKYFIYSHSFIPKMRLMEHIQTDKAPYDIWLKEGLLTVTETIGGVKTDYKYIVQHLKKLKEEYDLKFKAIAYDPHNADTFLVDLEEFGCDCIEIVQSAKSLHQATEDFKLEVDAGNILYHEVNGLLTWSVTNAKLTWNSFGECKIDKNYRIKRIDPIDAIIDAHKIVLMNKENNIDINESAEEYLKMMGW